MNEGPIKGETKEEYEEDVKKYFGNIEGAKQLRGKTADAASAYSQYLPGAEQEYKTAQRYEKGFTKTSRSGSFTDKPNASPAIFPSGLKFASEFIDENTPGKYKPKPKTYEAIETPEQTKQNDMPKLACVVTDVCMDCLKKIDHADPKRDIVCNFGMITQQNTHMLHAMGLEFGDPFATLFHATCAAKVKLFKNYTTPLVMGGTLYSMEDVKRMARWKEQLQIHDGRELNLGQWMSIKRLERIAQQTQDYIIEQRKIGNLSIFREDRVKV